MERRYAHTAEQQAHENVQRANEQDICRTEYIVSSIRATVAPECVDVAVVFSIWAVNASCTSSCVS